MRLLHYTYTPACTCASYSSVTDMTSKLCNNFFQIVAACDFYMCIGHIQKGIMKSDGEWESPLCVLPTYKNTIVCCVHSNGAVLACVSVKSDDVTLSFKSTLS